MTDLYLHIVDTSIKKYDYNSIKISSEYIIIYSEESHSYRQFLNNLEFCNV